MIFSRVSLIIILALGTHLAPLAAHAQQARKVPRIGYLSWGDPTAGVGLADTFLHGLRERSRSS